MIYTIRGSSLGQDMAERGVNTSRAKLETLMQPQIEQDWRQS